VAQRLVRLICPQCKEEDTSVPDTVRREMARSLGLKADQIRVFGKGCENCNKTGYYGRTAIYEILKMDESIRAMLAGNPTQRR